MYRLLELTGTFFLCKFCSLKHLTREGRDAHEQVCPKRAESKKS
jgi:hypothetical protein